jgi:hypothetical protein
VVRTTRSPVAGFKVHKLALSVPSPQTLAPTFYALYADRLVEREYGWTEVGRPARRSTASPKRRRSRRCTRLSRIENHVGTLLLAVAGLADTARVTVVLCERVAKVSSYAIVAVRPATAQEIKQWGVPVMSTVASRRGRRR